MLHDPPGCRRGQARAAGHTLKAKFFTTINLSLCLLTIGYAAVPGEELDGIGQAAAAALPGLRSASTKVVLVLVDRWNAWAIAR